MNFETIDYEELNSPQKEIYNFQKVAALLADYGFNCIKLSDDWGGADFLADHKDGTEKHKVQLKSRITINEKYQGKDLYMAFPIDNDWYYIKHDELIDIIRDNSTWLDSNSWENDGDYHSERGNSELRAALEEHKLDPKNNN